MPIAFQDLRPTDSQIELNSVTFSLRKFDLAAQTWAHGFFKTQEEPNGIKVLSERIQDIDDFPAVLETTWHLLKRKMHFNYTKESFFKAVEDMGDEKYLKAMEFRTAIVECLGVSQPQLEEIKGDLELKKSLAAGS